MIVRMKDIKEQPKLTEEKVTNCLASHFEWFRNLCFPNVFWGTGEMDLCVITSANYMWEIEVKLSLSDWKADEHKKKWLARYSSYRKYVSRFYYAVPTELIDKVPEFVPKEVGIIEIYWNEYSGYRTNIVRPSTHKRGIKLTDKMVERMMRKVYFKYWGKRMRGLS